MKHLFLFIGILFSGMALAAQIVVNNNPDPLVVCADNNNGFAESGVYSVKIYSEGNTVVKKMIKG